MTQPFSDTHLTVEVWFGGLRRVELKTLANTFSEYVTSRFGLHDLRHRLLNQRFHVPGISFRRQTTGRRPGPYQSSH